MLSLIVICQLFMLSLSESEELSESLVLSDSALLECAEAAAAGSAGGALRGSDRGTLDSPRARHL